MIRNAIIEIKGTQENDGEENVIELNTEGRFGKKDGDYFISYDESELSGLGDVKTVLWVKKNDSVVLTRSGSFESRLEIEKGKRSVSVYRTPQGDMMLGIYGEAIEHELTDTGGKLSLCYTIDSDLTLISRNTVNISVRGEQSCHIL